MTFEDVPPGAQPTKITPIANSAGNWKMNTNATAMAGIITYWATTPSKIGSGRFTTKAKSGTVKVIPMANIIMPSATLVYCANGAVWVGKRNPIRNAIIIITGNTVTATLAERSSLALSFGSTAGLFIIFLRSGGPVVYGTIIALSCTRPCTCRRATVFAVVGPNRCIVFHLTVRRRNDDGHGRALVRHR